jgi:hypothetical protein
MQTTYSVATAPELLEERARTRRRATTADTRRRLGGTTALSASVVLGSTITPSLLSRQFYDPNKQRHSTTYGKHYGRPDFEAIRGQVREARATAPRMTALTDTWDPTWH